MTMFAAAVIPLPARADEPAFVNVAGQRPAVLAAIADGAGDAQIEKLLTRPADLWERLRQGFAMPDLDSRLVAVHEAYYAARPELLRGILARARRYLHYIVEEVERRGLPLELALLPAVESGFNPMAFSSAQASGLWQFIPGTGARYKLAQTAHFDARRDVLASTGAALDYLQALHGLHHDWHLALASYNWGENSVLRAVAQRGARGNGFTSLSLPEETRNYVPRLMALRNIVLEPEKFGLDLGDLPDEPYFTSVALDLDVDLRLASRLAGVPYEDLLALNPGYNRPLAAGAVRFSLVVPAEQADYLRLSLERYREERDRAERDRAERDRAERDRAERLLAQPPATRRKR
jgi:membrane-bound lytic murein transglycosylase D